MQKGCPGCTTFGHNILQYRSDSGAHYASMTGDILFLLSDSKQFAYMLLIIYNIIPHNELVQSEN